MEATSMAGNSDPQGPGNDGSWFLEAVGALPAAPTPSETIAALESENTLPDLAAIGTGPGVLTTFDGSTGTSTTVPVLKVPEADFDSGAQIGIATPAAQQAVSLDVAPPLRTNRAFRWPTIAFGLFLLTVVALAVVWLPAALRQDAQIIQHDYAEASLAVREHLPTVQTALDTITDPASSPGELSSVIPIISELGSHSHVLQGAADVPLPRELPLVSTGILEELEPLRDTAQIQAARASDVARRLGHAYVYRTSIQQLLTTGELPAEADTQTINALSVDLASSLVEASTVFSDLPNTESMAALNDATLGAIERYASWQEEYLTALSDGNEETARSLISEIEELRRALADELATAMDVVRFEVDVQIVELAADLDTFLVQLTRR